jgi:hypothetical protein
MSTTTLETLRAVRADAEMQFQACLVQVTERLGGADQDLIATLAGFHREVSALHSTELHLIATGRTESVEGGHQP